MPVTVDSPVEDLKLPKAAASILANHNIKTVAHLTSHSRYYYAEKVWLRQYLPEIDAALAKHKLDYAPDGGRPNLCTICPTCDTCGNLRALAARNVVANLAGRATHTGPSSDVCEDCDAYHCGLVADRAAELAAAA